MPKSGYTVDASLIHLMPARRALGGWHLTFARAARSHAGVRALWRATGATSSPELLVFGRRLSICLRVGQAEWRDSSIHMGIVLPEKLRMSLVGREAWRVIDHDACKGRSIVAIRESADDATAASRGAVGTRIILNMDQIGIDRLGGGIAATLLLPAYVVLDKATDAVTWLRLRRMAQREEQIDCAWIEVRESDLDPITVLGLATLSMVTTLALAGLILGDMSPTALVAAVASSVITSLLLTRIGGGGFRISDDAMVDPPWERERRLRLRLSSVQTPDPTSTM